MNKDKVIIVNTLVRRVTSQVTYAVCDGCIDPHSTEIAVLVTFQASF